MTALFAFENVSVTIDDATVLHGVSTSLPAGSMSVLAGESGSGKTSMLRLCNRLDVPSAGSVMFRGSDLNTLDPLQLRRRVGMVFQQPVLFGGSVRDNLLTAEPDATEEDMLAALSGVELDGAFLDRVGDDLSGGEAQRVCLARALMCRPEVLLMDEPTSALHPAAARALEATVRSLHARGDVEVVWVTHDLSQIERLAEHLVVLRAGAVLFGGDPDTNEAREALATLTVEDP